MSHLTSIPYNFCTTWKPHFYYIFSILFNISLIKSIFICVFGQFTPIYYWLSIHIYFTSSIFRAFQFLNSTNWLSISIFLLLHYFILQKTFLFYFSIISNSSKQNYYLKTINS